MIRRTRLLASLALISLLALGTLARAEIAQKGNVRVTISGELSPQRLPRTGQAPIAVSVRTRLPTANACRNTRSSSGK